MTNLLEEFIKRFADFKSMELQFSLLSCTFSFYIEASADDLQLESIDFQAGNTLKNCFESIRLTDFSASLNTEKLECLEIFDRKFFVLF